MGLRKSSEYLKQFALIQDPRHRIYMMTEHSIAKYSDSINCSDVRESHNKSSCNKLASVRSTEGWLIILYLRQDDIEFSARFMRWYHCCLVHLSHRTWCSFVWYVICLPNIVTAHTVRSFLSRLEEKRSMSKTQINSVLIYWSLSTIALANWFT